MSTITPHLWFDTQAREAAEFYSEVFPHSQVTNVSTLHDTPGGDCDMVSFKVWGHDFMAISAGPLFKFNPSISFMVNFDPDSVPDAAQLLDRVWAQLADGGEELMPLGEYPFSKRYGWIADRYGVSWQLILTDTQGEPRPAIVPFLMFTGDVCGKAAETREFYVSVFGDSELGQSGALPGGIRARRTRLRRCFPTFGSATAGSQRWTALTNMASRFNEAVSLLISCTDQDEIDYYWERLSAVPEAEQCGWLKDRFGVSWQVAPAAMDEMMANGTPEQIDRVTQAFLPMKKFDLEALRSAYEGGD